MPELPAVERKRAISAYFRNTQWGINSVENLELSEQDIIVLSSDSEDINEGPSKGNVPKEDINEGPSKGKLPPLGSSARPRPEVGPELAKLFNPEKETKDKSAMNTFSGSTDEESSHNETTVGTTGKDILFYEDTIEKSCAWTSQCEDMDEIVQKIEKRPHGNSVDKVKGKVKD
nr:hypothetical protein [Tanacetum cinerariifolium]